MLHLNPKIIEMGQELLIDDSNQKGSEYAELGDSITWALALGMTTSLLGDDVDEDSLEAIYGVSSYVDILSDVPWTLTDGLTVASKNPNIFPLYNIYFEQNNVQYAVKWGDLIKFGEIYKEGIDLKDFTKEFHGLPAEVFIRHNETKIIFPLSIFEWRFDSINKKLI